MNDDDDRDNEEPSWGVSSLLAELNSDLRRLARACQLVIGRMESSREEFFPKSQKCSKLGKGPEIVNLMVPVKDTD